MRRKLITKTVIFINFSKYNADWDLWLLFYNVYETLTDIMCFVSFAGLVFVMVLALLILTTRLEVGCKMSIDQSINQSINTFNGIATDMLN